jgi:hypothetical protein
MCDSAPESRPDIPAITDVKLLYLDLNLNFVGTLIF